MVSSRRQFGQQVLSSLVLAGAWSHGWLSSDLTLASPNPKITPDQALNELLAGHQRFLRQKRVFPHQDLAQVRRVAQSQTPIAAILSCADSRVVPEIIFDQGLGDLFVVRVAGNIAITEEIASEEYAVAVLQTPLVMVLGHSRCGAVTAALSGKPLPGVIPSLVTAIQPAIDQAKTQPGDLLTNAIQANVQRQVHRLTQSPVLAEQIREGKLAVQGAYYDLEQGEMTLL